MGQTPTEHIEAYVLVVQAQQEEQKGRLDEALGLYRKGHEQYLKVARIYPQWQPEVVRYRISDCQNQMERIQRLLGQSGAPLNAPAPEADAPEINPGPAVDIAALQEEIEILELAVDEQEVERSELLEQMTALKGELETSRREADSLRLRLEGAADAARRQAEEILADRSGKEAQLRSLKESLGAAQQRVQQLERELAGARAAETQEVGGLRADLAALRQKMESDQALVADVQRREQEIQQKAQADGTRLKQLAKAIEDAEMQRRASGDERARLQAEVKTLRESMDLQRADVRRAREWEARAAALEAEKDELQREIAGLNWALERMMGKSGAERRPR